MKIWNDEVNSCRACSYCQSTYHNIQWTEYYCSKISSVIDDEDKIHPDCPFNKPITKEVFEELGFKLINQKTRSFTRGDKTIIESDWCEFRNDKADIFCNLQIQKPLTLNIHSRGHAFIGNCKPKINNPEELKFILNRLGI